MVITCGRAGQGGHQPRPIDTNSEIPQVLPLSLYSSQGVPVTSLKVVVNNLPVMFYLLCYQF